MGATPAGVKTTANSGFGLRRVLIVGYTTDGRYVCKDAAMGTEVFVNGSVQPAKGLPPQVGETWYIAKAQGQDWSLHSTGSGLTPDTIPTITGLTTAFAPSAQSLVYALEALGLVSADLYEPQYAPLHVRHTVSASSVVTTWLAPSAGGPVSGYLIKGDFQDEDEIILGSYTGTVGSGTLTFAQPLTNGGEPPTSATHVLISVTASTAQGLRQAKPRLLALATS